MSYGLPLPPFAGSCTALVTPFKNGAVDADNFCKLVDFQIDNGTAALVPVGTTGESPTLSHEEHDLVVELCIKQAAGRVPVITVLVPTALLKRCSWHGMRRRLVPVLFDRQPVL